MAGIATDHQYCFKTFSKAVFSEHVCRTLYCGLASSLPNRILFLNIMAKQLQFQPRWTGCHRQLHWQNGGLQIYLTAKWNVLRITLHIIVYVMLIANTIMFAKSIYTYTRTHIYFYGKFTRLILLLLLLQKKKAINTFSPMMSLWWWVYLTSKHRGTWSPFWTCCCGTST